jgi:hypothetical protein
MSRPLYRTLAGLVQARLNCIEQNNTEWRDKHEDSIFALVKEHMPSGSGFDSGTTLNLDKSTPEKLIFNTAYHHTNEHGYYCGWSHHTVTVTPSLALGFSLKISGRNVRDIKSYIDECFSYALDQEVKP